MTMYHVYAIAAVIFVVLVAAYFLVKNPIAKGVLYAVCVFFASIGSGLLTLAIVGSTANNYLLLPTVSASMAGALVAYQVVKYVYMKSAADSSSEDKSKK